MSYINQNIAHECMCVCENCFTTFHKTYANKKQKNVKSTQIFMEKTFTGIPADTNAM